MIFGIVERGNDRKNILGLLLSINLHYTPDDNTVCFLSCCPDTKKYIEDFPFECKNIKLVYFLFAEDNEMKGMDKFFNIMYTAIKKYGECCFLDTNLLMMEKFVVNDTIKEIGIGLIKYKGIRTHMLDKQENVAYSAQILYLNNIDYVDAIKKYYDDDKSEIDVSGNEVDASGNKIDASGNKIDVSGNELQELKQKLNEQLSRLNEKVSKLDSTVNRVVDVSANNAKVYNKMELIVKDVSRNPVKSNRRKTIPVFLKDKYNVKNFFETYTLIDINEFTAFENEIKPEELTSKFKIGDKSVNFVCLHCNTMNSGVVKLYRQLITKAANKSLTYMNIINLKKSTIPIVQPKREGVYKWDRTQDPSGMYQLTEMMCADGHFKIREEYEDYFVVGNNILMDKDSDFYISNRSAIFTEFYLCNYSKELTDALDTIEKPYQFFAYYSEYPKILEEFTKDKTFKKTIDYVELVFGNLVFHKGNSVVKSERCERNDDYESFLHQLKNVKYGYCKKGDIHLIATYLSLNVVPIVDSDWLLDLEKGIHYETKKSFNLNNDYKNYADNIEKYVKSNIKVEGLVRKLMSKILIGHV